MGISEVDLRRDENNKYENSTNVLSTCQVYDKLNIEGFQLFLPPSWAIHNTARLIVYANNELNLKLKPVLPTETHLLNIILEAGYGKSKTHYVNFFYREWKNSVTGKNDYAAQLADLSLLSDIWRRCLAEDKDFVAMGDANVCAMQWDQPGYTHAQLADIIKDFMLEENCCQVVDNYTRIRLVDGIIQRSCLDHVLVNCVDKISSVEIHGVGKSDHMGILTTKYSREVKKYTKTFKKRVYRNFDPIEFVNDIRLAKQRGKFDQIHNTKDIEVAGAVFSEVLDKHAPIKVIQNRRNYVPYLSAEIKKLMAERDLFKQEAARYGDAVSYNKYKELRNKITSLQRKAESTYYSEKYQDPKCSAKEMWKLTYQALGKNRSDFPNQMKF